jgi:hypothetical protein
MSVVIMLRVGCCFGTLQQHCVQNGRVLHPLFTMSHLIQDLGKLSVVQQLFLVIHATHCRLL